MTSDEISESDSQEEEQTQLYMKKGYSKGLGKGLGKGKGKGKKGKPGKGGYRDQQHKHVAPQVSFDGCKGKGKGKPPFKGKGQPFLNGNWGKGDAGHPHRSETGSSSYQQTRSKFNGRQQLLFDKVEDSVFSPNTCSWCLCASCDGNNCSPPPEEPLFYTQTNVKRSYP